MPKGKWRDYLKTDKKREKKRAAQLKFEKSVDKGQIGRALDRLNDDIERSTVSYLHKKKRKKENQRRKKARFSSEASSDTYAKYMAAKRKRK
jgi:hypothetical protein